MPNSWSLPIVALATGGIACAGTGALIPVLRRGAMLDQPNRRSSHTVPTPRGGGIAVVGAALIGWVALVAIRAAPPAALAIGGGGLFLAAVSWVDDRRSLSPGLRLATQFAAVGLGIWAIAPAGLVAADSWPPGLASIAVALLWVWFVNLFNFMDGIDGIAGSEAAAIGLGLVLCGSLGAALDPSMAILAAALAAAALGFLVWNWAPARIFLGDVGSIPLGYLLGYLLLLEAARGHWRAALILPLYFLADATITLLRRLSRGERVWEAHRRHFYQQAVRRGLSHADVVWRIVAADIALIGCAWAAENGAPAAGLAIAAAVVAALLANLAGLRIGGNAMPGAKDHIEEPPG